MSKAVICRVKTQLQAEAIITRLRAEGIQTADISLILQERAGVLGLAFDRDSHLNGRKPAAAETSGPVGGVLGMLSGIGILAIPGAGLHITAGPLNAALTGDGKHGATIGLAEALVRMGTSMTRARQYAVLVSQGQMLLAIQVWLPDEVARVQAILQAARAEDISEAADMQETESR